MTADRESWLHQWFAAGDGGDVDAFDDLLHTDVVVHAPLGLSTDSREAEKEVWRGSREAVAALRHDIVDLVVSGSTLAARVVVTGVHQGDALGLPASGEPLRIDQAVFVHLREGKAAEIWEIADTAALLRQLGATSLPGEGESEP